MIRLLAGVIVAECDPERDFVGHVGGDDLVVLFQSLDWEERCTRIIARFNAAVMTCSMHRRGRAVTSNPRTVKEIPPTSPSPPCPSVP